MDSLLSTNNAQPPEDGTLTKPCRKEFQDIAITGVPGEKPLVTSDEFPDSPSNFLCIHL